MEHQLSALAEDRTITNAMDDMGLFLNVRERTGGAGYDYRAACEVRMPTTKVFELESLAEMIRIASEIVETRVLSGWK